MIVLTVMDAVLYAAVNADSCFAIVHFYPILSGSLEPHLLSAAFAVFMYGR